MKLRLPKALCAAVFAAVAMVSTTASATDYTAAEGSSWWSDLNAGDTTTSDTVTVNAGSTLSIGTVNHSLGALNINGGTVNVTAGNSQNAFVKGGTVSITNGGTLNIDLKDTFGWGNTVPTAVNMEGVAGVDGADPIVSAMYIKARQTWAVANTNLRGNTLIAPAASGNSTGGDAPCIDFHGATRTMTVTGSNNVIDVALRTRNNVNVNVQGDLTLNGRIYCSEDRASKTLDFQVNSGAHLTITGDIEDTEAKIHEAGGTVTFGGGTGTLGRLTRLEMGDSNSASVSALNVLSGYTLAITGTNNNADYKAASFLIGEWNQRTTVTIAGNILSQGACLSTGDVGGTVNIENGGVLAVKGIKNAKDKPTNMNLVLKEGGSLILGSAGINFGGTGTKSFTLEGGTLGISDDSAINNALTVNGDVTVDTTKYSFSNGGTAIAQGGTATGGTLALKGDLSGTGSLTTAGSGTLQVGGITSNIDINHNAGTLEFAGTLTLGEGKTLTLASGYSINTENAEAFATSGLEYVDVAGNRSTEAHGFAEGTFTLVSGGTISGSATYTLGGQDWTLDNTHRTFSLSGPESRTTYNMMWGNEDSLAAIQTASQGYLTSVHMTGGTLTVDSALADGQSIEVAGDSTLSIAEGSVLKRSDVQVSSGSVTLDGAGEYVLGSPNLSETLAPGWTGIISVSGTKDAIDLNSYANTNSKVKLNGLAGWMAMGNALTTSKELIMGEGADGAPAFKITAMSEGKTIKFTNKISGHGVFEVCDNNNASGDTVEFSGDISGWDGTLKYNVNGTNAKTLKFSGSATEVNVGIENAAGTANVEIANGNAVTVNSTFSGSGTTNLKLTGDGAKEFTQDVTVNNVDATGGAVTFDQAATANGTFSAGAVTAKGALTLNGTSTADTITVEGGSVAVNGSLTLNGENTIAYDKVTVGAGATLATGTNGSLGSDGIVYAKGATITGGDAARNLSAWAGGYSVSGGEITINDGNGNNDNRLVKMNINGGAVTSNVTGTLTVQNDATMDSYTGGTTVFNGNATVNGLATIKEAGQLTVDGTLTLTNGLELLTKIDVTGVQENYLLHHRHSRQLGGSGYHYLGSGDDRYACRGRDRRGRLWFRRPCNRAGSGPPAYLHAGDAADAHRAHGG